MKTFIFSLTLVTTRLFFPTQTYSATCDLVAQPGSNLQTHLDSLKSNQTLCIKGGTYHQTINITQPNTCIKAYDNTPVILDGKKKLPTTSLSYNPMVDVEETAKNTTLEDIKVINSMGRAFLVEAEQVKLINVSSDWSLRHGIHIEASHVTVDGARLFRTNMHTTSSGGGAIQIRYVSDITVKNSTIAKGDHQGLIALQSRNLKLQNNTIFDHKSAQLYVDSSEDVLVENNKVFYTKDRPNSPNYAFAIRQESYPNQNIQIKNLIIRNNLFIGGEKTFAITFRDKPLTPGGPGWEADPTTSLHSGYDNWQIINNTIISNVDSKMTLSWLTAGFEGKSVNNNHFANNLIYQPSDKPIMRIDDTSIVYKYWTFKNNYYSKTPEPGGFLSQESGEVINSNPNLKNLITLPTTFNDFNPQNYHLTSSSPAVNAGTKSYLNLVNSDYLGSSRPHGSAPDIGFHEYGGTPSYQDGDLNQDWFVNIFDVSWLISKFTSSYSFINLSQLVDGY